MSKFGLTIIRLVTGSLLAGHGAQKLFGWFGGTGLNGMGGWLESMGLRPGNRWAAMAGLGEFGGGLLTALGLFHPVGPIMTLGPMMVATRTAHAGKPIWVSQGGAELPVTNMAIAVGLSLAGPGRFTLDRVFGIKLPTYLVALAAVGVALGIAITLASRQPEQQLEVEAATKETTEEAEEAKEAEDETWAA
jgi:putative oxidoreductase